MIRRTLLLGALAAALALASCAPRVHRYEPIALCPVEGGIMQLPCKDVFRMDRA